MRHLIAVAASGAVVVAACVHQSSAVLRPPNSPSVVVRDDRIDQLLSQRSAPDSLPGVVAALITPDSIWIGVTGIRKLGDSSLVAQTDRFHIGSNTKAMTAVLAGIAIEQGLLTWDSRPVDVFPELRDSIHPAFRNVSLSALMRMRAGIEPYMSGNEFNKLPRAVFRGSPTEQRRKFADHLMREPPFSAIGAYAYSNASYAIVAAMLEQVFQQSWEGLLPSKVGRPLGIQIAYGWPAKSNQAAPWGHWIQDGHLVPHDPNGAYQLLDLVAAGGAVAVPIEDFARFVQFNLRGLLGGNGVIRASTMMMLHQAEGPYAMGWEHLPSLGPSGRCAVAVFGDTVSASAHTGSAGTFFSFATVIPSRRVAVVVATNAATPMAGRSLNRICADMLRLRVPS